MFCVSSSYPFSFSSPSSFLPPPYPLPLSPSLLPFLYSFSFSLPSLLTLQDPETYTITLTHPSSNKKLSDTFKPEIPDDFD